jgi:hypothetical protein
VKYFRQEQRPLKRAIEKVTNDISISHSLIPTATSVFSSTPFCKMHVEKNVFFIMSHSNKKEEQEQAHIQPWT